MKEFIFWLLSVWQIPSAITLGAITATVWIAKSNFGHAKKQNELTASELYEIELAKHLNLMRDTLLIYRKQLWQLRYQYFPQNKHFPKIERTAQFQYMRRHYTTVDNEHALWLISIGLSFDKLKHFSFWQRLWRVEDVKGEIGCLHNRIDRILRTIDGCLISNEYLRNQCIGCPKRSE